MNKPICVGMLDIKGKDQIRRVYDSEGLAPALTAKGGGNHEVKVLIGAIRGRNPDDPTDRRGGVSNAAMS